MPQERPGDLSVLVLKLLGEKDMYGYEMIETLAARSDRTFELKAGTLYPILHSLERKGAVEAYEERAANDRVRRYYRITKDGRALLAEKLREWETFSSAVDRVLKGGANA